MEGKRPSLPKASLMDLPNEILIQIFKQLSYIDVQCNCANVNRRFRELAKSEFPNSIPHIHLILPENVAEQSGLLQHLFYLIKDHRLEVLAFSLRYRKIQTHISIHECLLL